MELLVGGREAFRAAAGLGNGPECSAGGREKRDIGGVVSLPRRFFQSEAVSRFSR
jgi:hypothetical protein